MKDIRKLIISVKTEQKSTKVIQRRLEAINALLVLPQGSTTNEVMKNFKTVLFLCHLDKGGRKHLFKIILQANNIMVDKKN